VRVLEAIVRDLEWWSALALALIGGWAIRLRRRSRVAERAIDRAASQPVLTASRP
jgi:hypothetical protein